MQSSEAGIYLDGRVVRYLFSSDALEDLGLSLFPWGWRHSQDPDDLEVAVWTRMHLPKHLGRGWVWLQVSNPSAPICWSRWSFEARSDCCKSWGRGWWFLPSYCTVFSIDPSFCARKLLHFYPRGHRWCNCSLERSIFCWSNFLAYFDGFEIALMLEPIGLLHWVTCLEWLWDRFLVRLLRILMEALGAL